MGIGDLGGIIIVLGAVVWLVDIGGLHGLAIMGIGMGLAVAGFFTENRRLW